MAVTKTMITDLSSMFADVDEDRITRLAEQLGPQVPASKWGTRRDLGLAYLIMHQIALGDFQKGKGTITKERLRDIERQYANSAGKNDGAYNMTVWGQQFVILRRQLLAGPRVTGSGL